MHGPMVLHSTAWAVKHSNFGHHKFHKLYAKWKWHGTLHCNGQERNWLFSLSRNTLMYKRCCAKPTEAEMPNYYFLGTVVCTNFNQNVTCQTRYSSPCLIRPSHCKTKLLHKTTLLLHNIDIIRIMQRFRRQVIFMTTGQAVLRHRNYANLSS